jgi:hypothetical protein
LQADREEGGEGTAAAELAEGVEALELSSSPTPPAPEEGEQQQEEEAQAAPTTTATTTTTSTMIFDEFLLDQDHPTHVLCPISLTLLTKPVLAMDSHTYNEDSLVEWIEKCRAKGNPLLSPLTQAPMEPLYF